MNIKDDSHSQSHLQLNKADIEELRNIGADLEKVKTVMFREGGVENVDRDLLEEVLESLWDYDLPEDIVAKFTYQLCEFMVISETACIYLSILINHISHRNKKIQFYDHTCCYLPKKFTKEFYIYDGLLRGVDHLIENSESLDNAISWASSRGLAHISYMSSKAYDYLNNTFSEDIQNIINLSFYGIKVDQSFLLALNRELGPAIEKRRALDKEDKESYDWISDLGDKIRPHSVAVAIANASGSIEQHDWEEIKLGRNNNSFQAMIEYILVEWRFGFRDYISSVKLLFQVENRCHPLAHAYSAALYMYRHERMAGGLHIPLPEEIIDIPEDKDVRHVKEIWLGIPSPDAPDERWGS